MKDNHSKNFKLISELSELMTKEKISLLVYEVSGLKLKIDKYESNQFKIENKKTEQEDNLLNERNSGVLDKIEYTSDHPGSIKSPMVGTAYASPEPGKMDTQLLVETLLHRGLRLLAPISPTGWTWAKQRRRSSSSTCTCM